jgi:hypothetical protein
MARSVLECGSPLPLWRWRTPSKKIDGARRRLYKKWDAHDCAESSGAAVRSEIYEYFEAEDGLENGLANLWSGRKITKKVHAVRGQENKWEIPANVPTRRS